MTSATIMLAATAMIYFGRGLWDIAGGLLLGFMVLGIVTRNLNVGNHLPPFGGTVSVIALALLLFGDLSGRNLGALVMILVVSAIFFGELREALQMRRQLREGQHYRGSLKDGMLIPPNSFEAQVAESEPQDPSANFENLSPTLSELAIQHSADVVKYPWEDYLVRKQSEGLEKEIVLTTANFIMHKVTKEAGEPVHERFFWYNDNFQTVTKPSHPFSRHGKEELAASLLVRNQLERDVETAEIDMEVYAKYRDEISAEAMKEGDHSIHGATQWMLENKETRFQLTGVPDRAYWQEYVRAWGNVFTRWQLDLRFSGSKTNSEVTDSGNEGEM